VPDGDATFLRWSDGVIDNPRQDIRVVRDINVTAFFSITVPASQWILH
jgi:hypothetical protein